MTSTYKLKFALDAQSSNSLVIGLLTLYKDSAAINSYRATSSSAGKQNMGSWNRRGGLLPPTSEVKENNGVGWSVSLQWRDSRNVSGVAGRYYPILPEVFETDGDDRSYTGVHADFRDPTKPSLTRHPGTMGCIGLQSERGWEAFQRNMDEIASLGIKVLELEVVYY